MRHFVFVLTLLLSAAVSAQEIQNIPPGEDVIVPLSKGQAAPFEGQLFNTNTALRWGFWLEQYKFHLKLDIDTALKTCAVNKEHDQQILTLRLDADQKIEADLRARLLASEKARLAAEDESRNPPWYRSREFGTITGVIGSAVVFVLSIYAVNAAQK